MPRLTTPDIARCALFAALIAGGAFVTIPIGPVPVTLQVLFVLLAGMVLGPRLALLSVAAYLALGLVAPVYAGGASGIGALFGPTGGYLVAFALAALATGLVARRREPTLVWLLLAGLIGLLPIYTLGPAWLAAQLDLSAGAAVSVGVAPFLALDVVKAMAAAAVARALVSLPLGLPSPQRGR